MAAANERDAALQLLLPGLANTGFRISLRPSSPASNRQGFLSNACARPPRILEIHNNVLECLKDGQHRTVHGIGERAAYGYGGRLAQGTGALLQAHWSPRTHHTVSTGR